MTLSVPPNFFVSMNRNVVVAISVVVFHIAALWALQTGLLRRAVELVVPAEILSEFIEPVAPKVAPSPAPSAPPTPVRRPVAKVPAQVATAAPQPLSIADPTPSPNAAVDVTPHPSVTLSIAAPVAAMPPAPAGGVELPSSDADYLQNPRPTYPHRSQQLGEQGTVLVHVLIGVDGSAQKVELKRSSGFDRLDQAALGAALRWRYVPGKRAGVPEAMWVTVPMPFILTN